MNEVRTTPQSYDEFLGLTYGGMLDRLAAEVPDKEMLVFGERRIRYGEFREKVLEMATSLLRLGLRKGDRVGLLLPNCPEYFVAQQAILYLGAIGIPLSTRYRRFEIGYMLRHAGAKFLFCVDRYLGTDFLALLEELRPRLPDLERLIVMGDSVPAWGTSYADAERGGLPVDRQALAADPPGPEDVASILYTSGSTGTPKGAMSSHRALIWDSTRVCERLKIGPDDVFLMMLPCSHIFASFVLFTNALMGRSKVVIMESFEPGEALRLQEQERVSVLYGVPTMFTLMLGHPEFDRFDLSSNRTGYMSGASCPVELVRAVMERMHCNISAAYGMTEGCCVTITRYEDDALVKARTAGYPIRDLELRIVDENRNDVEPGQVGEIAFRGRNLFSGYFKQPELTRDAHDGEGFFYTGDQGRLDEHGRLIVAGRKKDMIIRGGFNVYPAEVEEQIASLPGVQYVAVVGVPDERLGEKICACVLPFPGHRVDPGQVVSACRERLANYKVPDYVELLDEFPMTTTNKIQKFKLREVMERKYGKGPDSHA